MTDNQIQKIIYMKTESLALLSWSLNVECPHCEEDFDLQEFDHEYDNRFADALFNNRWEDVNGSEVSCPTCNQEFTITKIEY
jgi:C4-type Zn-finger protein